MPDASEPEELALEFSWSHHQERDDVQWLIDLMETSCVERLLGAELWKRHRRFVCALAGRAKDQMVDGPFRSELSRFRSTATRREGLVAGIAGRPIHAAGPVTVIVRMTAESVRAEVLVHSQGMEQALVDSWFVALSEGLAELADLGKPLFGSLRWTDGQLSKPRWLHLPMDSPQQMVGYWPAMWLPHSLTEQLDLSVALERGWVMSESSDGTVVRFTTSPTSVSDDERRQWRAWLSSLLTMNFAGSVSTAGMERPPDLLPEDWRVDPRPPGWDFGSRVTTIILPATPMPEVPKDLRQAAQAAGLSVIEFRRHQLPTDDVVDGPDTLC